MLRNDIRYYLLRTAIFGEKKERRHSDVIELAITFIGAPFPEVLFMFVNYSIDCVNFISSIVP